MICDRRFPLDFERSGLDVGGRAVRVKETPNSGEGTAHSVWDGAVVLAKHLEYELGAKLRDTCAVELGAGTGLAGCAAAALGASPTILTDLPYAMSGLEWACDKNRPEGRPGAIAAVADWSEPDRAVDAVLAASRGATPQLVLLADVVWVEELVEPLVATLEALCERCLAHSSSEVVLGSGRDELLSLGTGPLIIAAHQTRAAQTDAEFFAALDRRFVWRRVEQSRAVPAEFRAAGPLFVFEARLRRA